MLALRSFWIQPTTMAIIFMASAINLFAADPPGVSLILSSVAAEIDKDEVDVLVGCDVILLNETGKELKVLSNFSSAFDGVDLVVTDLEGKVLIQRQFTFHQSPHAQDREFVLKRGKTKTTLVFPLSALGKADESFKFRLVGVLPGSDFFPILSTETKKVSLKKKPKKD